MTMDQSVRVVRWQGSQHPSLSAINRLMHKDGLRPYLSALNPNHRQPARSHGYHKVIYVVEGAVEVVLPDSNQRTVLRTGDRLDVPAGTRHGLVVGGGGAKCLEATLRRSRATA